MVRDRLVPRRSRSILSALLRVRPPSWAVVRPDAQEIISTVSGPRPDFSVAAYCPFDAVLRRSVCGRNLNAAGHYLLPVPVAMFHIAPFYHPRLPPFALITSLLKYQVNRPRAHQGSREAFRAHCTSPTRAEFRTLVHIAPTKALQHVRDAGKGVVEETYS